MKRLEPTARDLANEMMRGHVRANESDRNAGMMLRLEAGLVLPELRPHLAAVAGALIDLADARAELVARYAEYAERVDALLEVRT